MIDQRDAPLRGLMLFKDAAPGLGAHELAPARISAQVPIATFGRDDLRHAPIELPGNGTILADLLTYFIK